MTTQLDATDREATALAELAVAAPPTLRAGRPRRGRPGRPVRPRSTRRSGRSSWPGTAAACRAVDIAGDDGAFEARHLATTGRRGDPGGAAAPAGRAPSPAGSTATGGSASRSTCAATARSSRTSGARRSRSRAARSGRTAGSPPRSAGRGRSGRSGRRSATTRCRSSCPCHRVVRTRRLDRPVLAGRTREQADDPAPPRASTPTRWRTPARRGERLVGCASTHIVCWPTCRTGRHMLARNRRPVPVARRGRGRRLPAVQGLPPGRGRRLTGARR